MIAALTDPDSISPEGVKGGVYSGACPASRVEFFGFDLDSESDMGIVAHPPAVANQASFSPSASR